MVCASLGRQTSRATLIPYMIAAVQAWPRQITRLIPGRRHPADDDLPNPGRFGMSLTDESGTSSRTRPNYQDPRAGIRMGFAPADAWTKAASLGELPCQPLR